MWLENNEILIQEPEYPFVYSENESESTDDSNAESHWLNDYPDTDYSNTDHSRDEDYDSDYSNNDDHLYGDPDEEEKKVFGNNYSKYIRMMQNARYSSSSTSSDDEGRSSDDERRSSDDEGRSSDDEGRSLDDEGRSSNYSNDESMGIL